MSVTTGSLGSLSETRRPHLAVRRVGAVLAGLLAIVILSTATDAVLHATGVYPPFPEVMAEALFVLAIAYRIVYGIAGGYIAARLAPDYRMQHALVLGGIGIVLSTAGAVAMWAYGPAWYSLANIAVAVPCAWVGGRLETR